MRWAAVGEVWDTRRVVRGLGLIVPACMVALVTPVLGEQGAADAARTRDAFLKMIDRPRVPLQAIARERPGEEGLAAEDITFFAGADRRVPVILLKPRALAARAPVVVVLHGTGGSKEGMLPRLRELARRGFIAVAPDAPYHGERAAPVPGELAPYQAAMVRAYRTGAERPFLYDTVWDVMRLFDYLETRQDVDAARIGLMGFSKGGMETYLTAAVDPRVSVAVPLIGVQSFGWALDHGAWDSRAWTLREAVDVAAKDGNDPVNAQFMRKFYDRVAPGIYGAFDGPAMLPLIAPRPLLVINGDSDPRTPVGGVRQCLASAEKVYTALGVPERLSLLLQPDAGHQVTAEGEQAAVRWMERWLRPGS